MSLPGVPTRSPLRPEFDALAQTVAELEAGVPPTHTHTIDQVTGLSAALAGKQALHATLTGLSGLTLADDTVLLRRDGGFELVPFADFVTLLGLSTGGEGGALFDVEAHGAVADDTTDCYPAMLSAYNAMLAFAYGGKLYGRTVGTYRCVLDTARVHAWPGKQRAAFPIPVLPRTGPKLSYGIKGVGEAYVERAADLGGEPGMVSTATVFRFEYDPGDFAWSDTEGLPSVFGCADADMTDPVGNSFSHVHFSVEDVILRNTANPSLTLLNLEQCSSARLGRVRFDLDVVLDAAPLPTRPTGAAYLLPRTNNNVTIQCDSVIAMGHFAGNHITEHCESRRLVSLRCRIGLFTRRANSHIGLVTSLKTEQCTWGISGWDPTADTAEAAVVGVHGWTGQIGQWGNEDYAYGGEQVGFYAPRSGAHINDPAGVLTGEVGQFVRMNSEPEDDPETEPVEGVAVPPTGGSSSMHIVAPGGTNTPMALYGQHHGQQVTRLPAYTAPVPDEHRLFAGDPGPSAAPTEGAGINVGLKVRAIAPCTAVALMAWRLDAGVNATSARLWEHDRVADTWTNRGDVAITPAGTAVWVRTADLAVPLVLQTESQAPDIEYVPTVHYPGNYPREGDYWGGGPGQSGLIVGPLKVYSDTDAGGQGCFSMGAIDVPPTISGSGADYGVDLVSPRRTEAWAWSRRSSSVCS